MPVRFGRNPGVSIIIPVSGGEIHIFADSLIIHGNFTGIRNQKSTDTFHQHGLAAAVVAHNAVNSAFLKIITDMMQHGLLAKNLLLTSMTLITSRIIFPPFR